MLFLQQSQKPVPWLSYDLDNAMVELLFRQISCIHKTNEILRFKVFPILISNLPVSLKQAD